MNNEHRIPEHVMRRGIEAADGAYVFGVPIKEMTHDELIAIAALGWQSYSKQLERVMSLPR